MTTALILLRAKQLNMNFDELALISTGELIDMLTEQANDQCNWPIKATQSDIDKLFSI